MRKFVGAGLIGAAGLMRILAGAAGAFGVLGLSATPIAVGAPPASDVKPVTPYAVVVKADGAAMRCSDTGSHYPVRMLRAGEVLRVDGEHGGWLRVEYLQGMLAYVPAKDAKLDGDGKILRLTQASTLMALNVSGVRPWWPLLDKDLPTGTTFADPQAIKATDGTVEGYAVAAPALARGYVRSEQVRKATADEGKAAGGQAAAPKAASTPATPPTTPAPAPTTTAGADSGKNPLPPVNPPPDKPMSLDKSFENAGNDGAKKVAVTTTTTPAPAPTKPAQTPEVTKRIADLELLRDMFERAIKSDGSEAELATVEKEFNRTIDGLGTSPEDQRLKIELNKRMDALKLKRQVYESRKASQAATLAFDQRVQSIKVAMQEVEKQAVYTIVGTMIPSTVYDGKRGLPLMFRIESPDVTSTRTVGYVVPRGGLDLVSKTGRVVGIVGDSKLDPALGVNIVLPRRVDVLRFVEGKYQVESSQSVGNSGDGKPFPGTSESTPPPPEVAPAAGAEPPVKGEPE